MAKSISLQLKEHRDALDISAEANRVMQTELEACRVQIDELTVTNAAAQDLVEARDADLAKATVTIAELRDQLEADKTAADAAMEVRDEVTEEIAANLAADTLAGMGVAPVAADTVEAKAQSKEELHAQYMELIKTDPRAAGEFYTQKVRPLIYKETK